MPRKKNWKVSKARKNVLQSQVQVDHSEFHMTAVDSEGISCKSDGRLARTQKPSDAQGVSLKSDGGLARPQKPSDAFKSVSCRSDGGLAHPHKPSDAKGVSLKSDGGLARPQKPSDAFDVLSVSEMCLNSLIDLKMNLSDQCN
ncbi:hypothetical protein DPMN_120257 [Dreissena polymorpha]|uniref:Uncharacterized protein n=1 Tax=Dreissena polymorpha TaxID=45954 RepID=A0A9D4GJE8_DREPO|nr:hypothetical protein DPMN_120257 [Dreissena polymorpha]